jgi:tetratricopeptide (TPR) repeat protein
MGEMMEAAGQIVADQAPYTAALRDWVARGADSEFALSPADVVARSGDRGVDESMAAAEFELAQHLFRQGDLDSARTHFREAHRLAPNNWTYKRQAWSVEPSALEGPMARFWQGPLPGAESDWAYEGDWVKDATAGGMANYYPRFRP